MPDTPQAVGGGAQDRAPAPHGTPGLSTYRGGSGLRLTAARIASLREGDAHHLLRREQAAQAGGLELPVPPDEEAHPAFRTLWLGGPFA
jgi:hypothetical protein